MSIPASPSSITVTPCYCSATLTFPVSSGATYYTVSAKNSYGCITSYSVYNPSSSGNITTPMPINVPGSYVFSVTASNSNGTSSATVSPSTCITCGYCCPTSCNPYPYCCN